MELPPVGMWTKTGVLKAPPYPQYDGMKRAACLKEPHLADIISDRFNPAECRNGERIQVEKKPFSDRGLERQLNTHMKISAASKEECELAKKKGEKSYRITRSGGRVIEVFFEVDLDLLSNRRNTFTGKSPEEIDQIVSTYQQVDIPAVGWAFYIALDNKYRRMFAYFGGGFEAVYGAEVGKWVVESTTWNIEEYAEIQPPELPKDKRLLDYEKWILSKPHLCHAPWARSGIYRWGAWMERGHASKGLVITKDSAGVPGHVQPVKQCLFESFENMTKAKNILLGALDKHARDRCEKTITEYPSSFKLLWSTSKDNECFTLRTCLINLYPEPQHESGDLNDGWVAMAPLGEFHGGEFCIKDMHRRFVFQPGGIGFIKGGKLEHFTTTWQGVRFCMVSAMHK